MVRWDSRRGILQCFPHLRHLRITHPHSRPFGIPPPTAPRALRPPVHRDPRAKGVILTFVMVTKSDRTDPSREIGQRTHTTPLRQRHCALQPGVTPGMRTDCPSTPTALCHKVRGCAALRATPGALGMSATTTTWLCRRNERVNCRTQGGLRY